MVISHSYVAVYQRVPPFLWSQNSQGDEAEPGKPRGKHRGMWPLASTAKRLGFTNKKFSFRHRPISICQWIIIIYSPLVVDKTLMSNKDFLSSSVPIEGNRGLTHEDTDFMAIEWEYSGECNGN